MLRIPSWKWLSFRPTRELVAGRDAPPQSRPCLPAVEKLDDRVMLSVTPNASEVPPLNGDTQILIGLLKGQLELVGNEVNALTTAADITVNNGSGMSKLNASFLKIDKVITDFGQSVLKHDPTEKKIDKAMNDLKIEFNKIDALFGGLGDTDAGARFKVVLDTLEHKATELIGLLDSATGAGDLDVKIEKGYLKAADSFLGLDGAVLKSTEDAILARKAGKGQQEYLQIKLQDVQISALKIEDGDVRGQLLDLEKLTAGLLQTGGDFTGGVTTDGGTGDVLA